MVKERSAENDNILGPWITQPSDAKNVLNNFHNGFIELSPEEYTALYNLSCKDSKSKKPSPKKIARSRGKRLRKKRTGSRRG